MLGRSSSKVWTIAASLRWKRFTSPQATRQPPHSRSSRSSARPSAPSRSRPDSARIASHILPWRRPLPPGQRPQFLAPETGQRRRLGIGGPALVPVAQQRHGPLQPRAQRIGARQRRPGLGEARHDLAEEGHPGIVGDPAQALGRQRAGAVEQGRWHGRRADWRRPCPCSAGNRPARGLSAPAARQGASLAL